MNPSHNSLQSLAERMHCGGAPSHRVRETLEASLIPVVRRVLRTGAGLPQLVQWVHATLPQVAGGPDRTRPVDPDRAAPPLARLLCATLLRQQPTRPPALAAETVAGL
jgi:hypothetical protein